MGTGEQHGENTQQFYLHERLSVDFCCFYLQYQSEKNFPWATVYL